MTIYCSDDLDDTQNENSNLSKVLDADEDLSVSSPAPSKEKPAVVPPPIDMEGEKLPFPTQSDLNTRLRRLITGYQRNHKKQLLKDQQKLKVGLTLSTLSNYSGLFRSLF